MKLIGYNTSIILTLVCWINVFMTSCQEENEPLVVDSVKAEAGILGKWVEEECEKDGVLNHFEFTTDVDLGNFMVAHQSLNGLHLEDSSIGCNWAVDDSGILTITHGKTVVVQEKCTVNKGYLMMNGRKLVRDEDSKYAWIPYYYAWIEPDEGQMNYSTWYCKPGTEAELSFEIDYTGNNYKVLNSYVVISYDSQTQDTIAIQELENQNPSVRIKIPEKEYPNCSFTLYSEYEMTGIVSNDGKVNTDIKKISYQHMTKEFVVGTFEYQ